MKGEPKLVLAFLATLLLLAANGYVSQRAVQVVTGNERLLAHTEEALSALEALQSTVTDAETGQRGFVLTGREPYLLPYQEARASLSDRLGRLRSLTADNPVQQARLPLLESTIQEKLAELGKTLELRRTGGLDAALAVVETGRGASLMSSIREIVAGMKAEENRLLKLRVRESEHNAATVQATMWVANLIAITLLAAFTFLAFRRLAEQLHNAQLLAEHRDRLQVTLESIGDAVLATDERGCVQILNPVAGNLLGWSPAEAEGRPLAEVFHIVNEETRKPAEDPVEKAIRLGMVVGLANHTIVISRDGRETPIEDSAAPIKGAKGKILGVVLVFRDVSERKRFESEQERLAEGERMARIQAEEANRSKDEFLATVSHELRNPLNAIAGWTVILRNGPADEQACQHAAEVIARNARALTRIVEDILDVSRIVTGKLHIEPRETELTPVVQAAVDSVRPAAEAKRIRIETRLAPAGPVWGDPDRLQQVIWNLVSNAVKFTPKEGSVEVRLYRADSQVEIVVSDNGPGIPGELLPHVFDRFRQADSTSTRRHGGLGLGLAIVRHLVELHGGNVAVASGGPGLGTTFTVSLPVRTLGTVRAAMPAAGELREPPFALAAETPLLGLRTLVVEDDPDSLEMVCTLLAQRGADVRPAASTAEALAVIECWKPDLLISDLGMPEEDGYTLIRRVRALPADRGGQVPAVALSARTRPEDRIEALSAGFQMHVAKPVAPAELLAVAVTLAGPGRIS
ncbi:MAG TPA: CHASE3 domain-containing protein [Thermoanaerobaculia bacterium]|jgi:PAS domain S-box-containing protein|nr:CHASE3 domain-containing protein [Thermoanaerobaculia bacterium]